MIRIDAARFVAPRPIELSSEQENRAHRQIWQGEGTVVSGPEAERLERLMKMNSPNGRISTRLVAGELFVFNGKVYFKGLTGEQQPDGTWIERLLDLGPNISVAGRR